VIRAAIIGVSGRMGRAVVRAASEMPDVSVVAAVASAASPALGNDVGELAGVGTIGVPVTNDLPAALSHADVVLPEKRSWWVRPASPLN
jgi:4-hydroxy-tetrahydrodipicolinate reductase